MAAEAKKPKRKKTTQRSPSRLATSGRKVAKAGASAAAKKRPARVSEAPRASQPPSARGPKSAAPPSKGGSGKAAELAKKKLAQREREKAAREKEHARSQREKQNREKERLKAQRDKEQQRLQAERVKALREKEREKQEREKERAKLERSKEQERQKAAREKEAERVKALRAKEHEKQQALRAKEQERVEQAKAKAATLAERAREKARLEQDREAARAREVAAKQNEKDRQAAERVAERERQLAEKQEEKEAQRRAREAELVRQKDEREAEKETQRLEKEAERNRLKAEKEVERQRQRVERDAERDRLREETRRQREEERSRREAEREAFRKAKETEQTRIRTERAAARRALEGRVARASGRAAGGARASTTTRVYSPASIPDQSGTRRGDGSLISVISQPPPSSVERTPGYVPKPRTLPPPPPPPEPPASIEERYAKVQERLKHTSEDFRAAYEENFLMSWIHHDSALEGVVYTYEELRTAVNPNVSVVPDSSLQSVCEEIRRHKAAIEVVRELGERKRQPATLDQLKRIFLTLHPEEGDLKTVRYRKEIPQHRMYFHEYAAPDKIPYKVRQIFDWLNGPEPKKLKSPLRVAGRVHYDLIRIFPFAKDSGKVARLFMNMLLLRADYPPAILHSTERQRYYEALKGSPNTICNMLESAIANALQSIDRQLGTQDTRLRAIVS
jgi:hypothetical protein